MAERVKPIMVLALLAVVTAACSSSPPEASLGAGELDGGTAKVSVGRGPVVNTQLVDCRSAGAQTAITTGENAGVTAVTLDSTAGLSALSVELRDVDGFTGSYWQGLGEAPEVTLGGRTYLIEGTATGFSSERPSARISERYSIQVAC